MVDVRISAIVVFAALSVANCQTVELSPCPNVFKYELPGSEPGRWYGVVTLSTDITLHGLWLNIVLDGKADILGSWVGEVTTTDNVDFKIENTKLKIHPGPAQTVHFFIQYNQLGKMPRLTAIRLNGREICSSNNPLSAADRPTYSSPNDYTVRPVEETRPVRPSTDDKPNRASDERPVYVATESPGQRNVNPSSIGSADVEYLSGGQPTPDRTTTKMMSLAGTSMHRTPPRIAAVGAHTSAATTTARASSSDRVYDRDTGALIIMNELLCFVDNKINTLTEMSIIKICLTTFSSADIETARKIITEAVRPEKLILRATEGREERSIKEIVTLMKEGDPDKLPIYVARDLNKLPPVKFDHVDITVLLKDIALLKQDISELKSVSCRKGTLTMEEPGRNNDVMESLLTDAANATVVSNSDVKSNQTLLQSPPPPPQSALNQSETGTTAAAPAQIPPKFTTPPVEVPTAQTTDETVKLTKIHTYEDNEFDAYRVLVPMEKRNLFLDDKLWPDGIVFRCYLDVKNQCGKVARTVNPPIVNTTTEGQWPWHIALYQSQTVSNKYICGGTLVSRHYVVTAAHCVTRKGSSRVVYKNTLIIFLGKHNLRNLGEFEEGVQINFVDDIIVHRAYNASSYSRDVGVLRMHHAVKITDTVRPICLWPENQVELSYVIGKRGSVVGWGFDDKGQPLEELTLVEMPVVEQETCIRSYRDFYARFTSEYTYCAGSRDSTSVCNGDSGGGMVLKMDDAWYLRGLVSLSVAIPNEYRCDPTHYVVFTDLAKFLPWLKLVISTDF